MSKPKYGEPWHFGVDGDGPNCLIGFKGMLSIVVNDRPDAKSIEVARRITLCISACAGVSNESLAKWIEHLDRCGQGDSSHLEQFFDESEGW